MALNTCNKSSQIFLKYAFYIYLENSLIIELRKVYMFLIKFERSQLLAFVYTCIAVEGPITGLERMGFHYMVHLKINKHVAMTTISCIP